MSRKSTRRRRRDRCAPVLLLAGTLLVCGVHAAPLCDRVEQADRFVEQDRVASDYFDAFFVRRQEGVFYVLATKRLGVPFVATVRALDRLEEHAQFLPGYRGILVQPAADGGGTLTAIRFQPDFAWFESRFTNRVEVDRGTARYEQCWQQLAPDDAGAIEPFAHAPSVNFGYWRVAPAPTGVSVRYFIALEPPVPVPVLLYRRIVRSNYRDLFERVANRAATATD